MPGGCGSNEPYTGYYEAVVATVLPMAQKYFLF